MLRARRGARLAAVTNAGVIPDQFDYDVVLLPEEHRVGTLNEDFAFESLPGDIFQLGNASYRIAKVETGKVMVEDAQGPAAHDALLAGREPGPHRRAVRGGVADLRDAPTRCSTRA